MQYGDVNLFLNHIKPAILFEEKTYKKHNIDVNDYYHTPFRAGIVISHKPLPKITNSDNIKLGKVLGYYPKSCDLFFNESESEEFIWYGGIHFNTGHLYNEALDWCHQQYKDKLIEKFGIFKYYRSTYTGKHGSVMDHDSVTTIRKREAALLWNQK
ncbi:hypothetical protein D3C81_793530 [compost metagenome]